MIKKALCAIANSIWIASCAKGWGLFDKAAFEPLDNQIALLFEILKNNKNTIYGRRFNFSQIRTYEDYRRMVPLSTYTDYERYIKDIGSGDNNVLTQENVNMFEVTSGSTAAFKLIPYTNMLKSQFQNGINPWIYNLYTSNKRLLSGKSYWSITPVCEVTKKRDSKVPVGFEEDTEYLLVFQRIFSKFLFSVPTEVKKIVNIDTFRYVTLLFLLKEKDLRLISVWNPTFLILLLRPLNDWFENIVTDLEQGCINPPSELEEDLRKTLSKKLGKNPKRAAELLKLYSETQEINFLYAMIWPKLEVISCWADANARSIIPQIQKCFPNAHIQPKGLIATEGFISFPIYNITGGALAIRSHFFEFIEFDYKNNELLIDNVVTVNELAEGKTYSIVITTGGGFYRYMLQDLIIVVGFYRNCPMVEFIGKEDKISDYFGEKLHENHVDSVLKKILNKYEIEHAFGMVAPELNSIGDSGYYTLFLELVNHNTLFEDNIFKKIADDFESELMDNFHYRYCRELKQLSEIKLFLISKNGLESYLNGCVEMGQKLGNIKPTVLSNRTGWSNRFTGKFLF